MQDHITRQRQRKDNDNDNNINRGGNHQNVKTSFDSSRVRVAEDLEEMNDVVDNRYKPLC